MVKYFLGLAVICFSSLSHANIVFEAKQTIVIDAYESWVSIMNPAAVKNYGRQVVGCRIEVKPSSFARKISAGSRFILGNGSPDTKQFWSHDLPYAVLAAFGSRASSVAGAKPVSEVFKDELGVDLPTVVSDYVVKSEASSHEFSLRCYNVRELSNDQLAGQLAYFGLLVPVTEL